MSEEIWFVLFCRICTPLLPMPFETAEERGKWAAGHTKGTGHDSWFVIDQPKGRDHEDSLPVA